MKLSLCITTYNRPELTIKAFEKVHNDERIDEIVIVDDCSTTENYNQLVKLLLPFPKVQLYRNYKNLGMHLNKREVIEKAKNEWCILFDSDNIIGVDYLDVLFANIQSFKEDVIYAPGRAKPKFDYRIYSGIYLFSTNLLHLLDEHAFQCLLNTCNYVCHRNTYLRNFVLNELVGAADSIWHMYNHFRLGGKLLVISNMSYQHLVHDDSGWRQNRLYNLTKFNEALNLIIQLTLNYDQL